jgi:L-fuconolactonase
MIDGHVHFWRLARGVNTALTSDMTEIYRDVEPEELLPMLEAFGLRAAIAVQASETLGENLFMAGLAQRHPWIAGVVGWVDPGSPSIAEELAGLCTLKGIVGVRPVRDDNRSIRWMRDPALQSGWAEIAGSGLPIDLLVQDWRELDVVLAMAEAFPDTRFVLDHCGKPDIRGGRFDGWAAQIEAIARRDNTFCKFSGLASGAPVEDIAPYGHHVIDCFGARRLIWASDWPPLDLASSYREWMELSRMLTAGLTNDERYAIWHRTAEAVYGVTVPHATRGPIA